jgi:hypothetical protein
LLVWLLLVRAAPPVLSISSAASLDFDVLDFDDVDLESVDGSFLRGLVSSHSGSPVLDLEAAAPASRQWCAS